MGIDRHEWEHRNYKSGRDKIASSLVSDEDLGPLAADALLGDAPPPPAAKPDVKASAKTAVRTVAKGSAKDTSKDNKTTAKAKPGAKRSARAG